MARAPKVTWERINHMIAIGAGSGFGDAYQPLIQIKRWNPSPVGIHYLIGDHQAFQRRLFGNLESIQSSANLNQHHGSSLILKMFIDKHGHKLHQQHLGFVREVLIKDYKCTDENSILIRNNLIWHQIIDLDLSIAINESQLPRPGGRAFKQLIRSNLEGK